MIDCYASLVAIAKNYTFVIDDGKFGGRWANFFNKSVSGLQGVPWCASFVCSCVMENKERNKFQQQIYLNSGVLSLWTENPVAQRKYPRPGLIVCWKLSNTDEGHCGIVTAVGDNQISTVEGDTSPELGAINRTGHCVAEKSRPLGPMGHFQLLGFIDSYNGG